MCYVIVLVIFFEQNCIIFWCEKIYQVVVIDFGGDIDCIFQVIEGEGLILVKIFVMYGYIDYVGGVVVLVE